MPATNTQLLICCQVFDYPTLSAIVGYLDTTLAAQQPQLQQTEAAAPTTAAAAARVPAKPPAAAGYTEQGGVTWISAVHSRFPDPPATAAAAVVAGGSLLHDVISVVPVERYDAEVQLTQDLPARFGGFLAAVQVRRMLLNHKHQCLQHAALLMSLLGSRPCYACMTCTDIECDAWQLDGVQSVRQHAAVQCW